mgnify:CR=1 FL=1
MMDPGRADIEIALRNPYQEKPRTFPALRSKSQMPWVRQILYHRLIYEKVMYWVTFKCLG